jgi:hypothetical protein
MTVLQSTTVSARDEHAAARHMNRSVQKVLGECGVAPHHLPADWPTSMAVTPYILDDASSISGCFSVLNDIRWKVRGHWRNQW